MILLPIVEDDPVALYLPYRAVSMRPASSHHIRAHVPRIPEQNCGFSPRCMLVDDFAGELNLRLEHNLLLPALLLAAVELQAFWDGGIAVNVEGGYVIVTEHRSHRRRMIVATNLSVWAVLLPHVVIDRIVLP